MTQAPKVSNTVRRDGSRWHTDVTGSWPRGMSKTTAIALGRYVPAKSTEPDRGEERVHVDETENLMWPAGMTRTEAEARGQLERFDPISGTAHDARLSSTTATMLAKIGLAKGVTDDGDEDQEAR